MPDDVSGAKERIRHQYDYPNAEEIAQEIGDIFVNFHNMKPLYQWNRICLELNNHGFAIIRDSGE